MTNRDPVSQRVPGVSGHGREWTCPRVPPPTGGTTGHGHDPEGSDRPAVPRVLPGVNAALANAVRVVNARFNRLPRSVQDSIVIEYDGLDREIDAAILSGDRERALAAIGAWQRHWTATFEEAAR